MNEERETPATPSPSTPTTGDPITVDSHHRRLPPTSPSTSASENLLSQQRRHHWHHYRPPRSTSFNNNSPNITNMDKRETPQHLTSTKMSSKKHSAILKLEQGMLKQ